MTRNIEEKLRQYRLSKQQQNADPSGLARIGRSTHEALGYCAGLLGLNQRTPSSLQPQPESQSQSEACPSASMEKVDTTGCPARDSEASRVNFRGPRKTQVVQKEDSSSSHAHLSQDVPREASALDWVVLALQFAVWLLLFLIFVQLEFGAVFFVFSIFYLMWRNFRTDRRKPYEPSAYSVFNPNCEAIDGTLLPEQFEREIRRGF